MATNINTIRVTLEANAKGLRQQVDSSKKKLQQFKKTTSGVFIFDFGIKRSSLFLLLSPYSKFLKNLTSSFLINESIKISSTWADP